MDSSEVIDEIMSLMTDEAEQRGGFIPMEPLGDGWLLVANSLISGVNNGFEIVTPDGSVHRLFAVRVR